MKIFSNKSSGGASEEGGKLTRRQAIARGGMALGTGMLLPGQLAADITGVSSSPKFGWSSTAAGGPVVFTHTTVVTGDANRAQLKDVALAVSEGKIAAIGPTDTVLKQFPRAEVIDGSKKALLPGVVNCHAHLAASIARGFNEDFSFPNRSGIEVTPASLLSGEERTLMAMIAALHSIRNGTTTVVEYSRNIASEAADLAKTGLRWVFAESVNDREDGYLLSPEKFGTSTTPVFSASQRNDGLQRIEDLFSAWHGKHDGLIQVFPAVTHAENASPELLHAIRGFAEKHDLGYTIHANQTYAEVQYMLKFHGLRPVEYMHKHDFLGPRLFVGHARYVNDNEVALMGKTKSLVAHQAAMAANRGVSPPIPAMRAAGVTICMGTDNNNNDMFAAMKVGMLTERIRMNAEFPGMFPQPEDVFQDAALNGAIATRQSDKLGLLEVGKKADILVLNTHQAHLMPCGRILSAWLHNGQPSDIESVMVDGKFVMRDHKILTVDEEAILAEASKVGKRVWDAVEKANPIVPPGRTNWH